MNQIFNRLILFTAFLFWQFLTYSQIKSNASGMWSSPTTWVGGVVPNSSSDVVIQNNHIVTIDLNPVNNAIIDLCKSLTVDINASLRLGYSGTDLSKQFAISGNLQCDGTISAGRNVPTSTSGGDGLIYDHNSSLILNLTNATTTISGKGYLHVKHLMIQNQTTDKKLVIDHYNVFTDEDFLIKGTKKVEVEIAKYTYINVGGTFAAAGKTYSTSPTNYITSILIKGIVFAKNVSLFTKNPTDPSSITLDNEGVLTANNINGGVASALSGAGGFTLTLNDKSIFRCGLGVSSPVAIASSDPNFSVVNSGQIKIHYSQTLTSGATVLSKVNAFDKNDRTKVEPLKDKIGATHIGGWYNFTDKPYLKEGSDRFKEWGSRTIKTTISADNGKMYEAYPFNSTWPQYAEMADVIKETQVDELFADPYFTSHAFWAPSKFVNGFYKEGADRNHARYLEVEEQNYRAAKELLTRYGNMGKTFTFQNWEGDWMLRGNNKQWEDDKTTIPDDVNWEVEGMARMWRASMCGIERAVAEFPNATSKIQYAVEFNKLFTTVNGVRKTMMDVDVPCVVADVIPKVRMHLSSWSAYDGNWEETNKPYPTGFWNGMEIAAYYTNSTKGLEGIPVQIGEIGINENAPFQSLTDAAILDRYAKIVGMVSALGVQKVYIWNLYASGAQSVALEKNTQYSKEYLYQVLDGKWIIEPDNTFGLVGNYLKNNFFLDTNTKPIVKNKISDQSLNQGFGSYKIDLTDVFFDGDADPLTLSATVSNAAVATTSIVNNILTITEKSLGITVITVTADDGHEGKVSLSFRVEILAAITPQVFIGNQNYTSITLALDAAQSGDIIEIRGIHTETLSIDKSLTIKGLDPKLDKIQAAQSLEASQSRVVTITQPAGSTSAINVTFENVGIRYGKSIENGGGISADKMGGLLTLKNVIINNNSTDKNGGGLSVAGGNAELIGCVIQGNRATLDGGGVILAPNNSVSIDNTTRILNTLIDSNKGRNGGAIYINGNKGFGNNRKIEAYLENTTVSNNEATSASTGIGGGGIWSKCAFWTGDNTTGNVTLKVVHSTFFGNTHLSADNNGLTFTSDPAGAETNFSLYNSLVVSHDDVAEKSLNFLNAKTINVVNNILGGVGSAPTILTDASKKNTQGKTASYTGLSSQLINIEGTISVLELKSGANSVDYCTAITGITLPSLDARGATRDIKPDAGAYEYLESMTVIDTLKISNDRTMDKLIIGSNGTLIVENTATLTIKSDLQNSGKVIVQSGGSLVLLGSASGNATIIRNTQVPSGGYSIVGSPVTGANLSSLGADHLYTYREAQRDFVVASGTMTPGVGYFLGFNTSSPQISLTGGLVTGSRTTAITKSGDGFNLVANPYAAAISISDFLSNESNKSAITGTLYFWDDGGQNVGSTRGGDYITVNFLGVTVRTTGMNDGVSGKKGETAAKTGNICSLQGFFVEALQTGQVTFTPEMQVTSSFANTENGFYRKLEEPYQIIKLSLANTSGRDELIVGFTKEGSFEEDYGLDAVKFDQQESLAFYSFLEDRELSIQGLPLIRHSDKTNVDLGVYLEASESFNINVEEFTGFGDSIKVSLLDHSTNTYYPLQSDKNLAFEPTDAPLINRFSLVFGELDLLGMVPKPEMRVYMDQNQLHILYPSNTAEEIVILSIAGQVLFNGRVEFENGKATIEFLTPTTKICIVRLNSASTKFFAE